MKTVFTTHVAPPDFAVGSPSVNRFLTFLVASALGLALFTSVISATSASAHAELVKITPAPNAQLNTVPKRVVLSSTSR